MALAAIAATTLVACEPVPTTTIAISANKNVTIMNNTGRTIWRFYGSPLNVNSWDEDILESNTLPAGRLLNVNFTDGRRIYNYDMRAEF